jgi:hypothetical protein
MSELTRLIEAVRKLGIDHTGCEPSISCFHQAVDNLRMALENPPAMPDKNDCALKTITDSQVNAVARAFWRRIYPYRNDYERELPDKLPVEFFAHMATALSWADNPPKDDLVQSIFDASNRKAVDTFKHCPKCDHKCEAQPAAIPESWRLTKVGQIKVGDVISMVMAGRRICTSAKEVLNAGTDREEVIYNRKKNHYFITSMVLNGTSNHKEVFIIPGDSLSAAPKPEGEQ